MGSLGGMGGPWDKSKVCGSGQKFAVFQTTHVFLHGLHPDAVRVELYADRKNDEATIRQEMKRDGPPGGEVTGDTYSGSVPATRPATDFTPRIVPSGMTSRYRRRKNEFSGGTDHSALTVLVFHLIVQQSIKESRKLLRPRKAGHFF